MFDRCDISLQNKVIQSRGIQGNFGKAQALRFPTKLGWDGLRQIPDFIYTGVEN
jgi:hypothetical protein